VSEEKKMVVDGVDLTKLTAEQLAGLTKEEWHEFEATFKAAAKARAEQELAKNKSKLITIRDYVMPVVRYALWTAIALRVFGII